MEVKANIPMMQQKGDTIQYNAAAIKAKPGGTALDLVNKMPGFSTDDGVLKNRGKQIQRIYLNGREFFSDNPQGALTEIPANAVNKIKVYEEVRDKNEDSGKDNDTELIRSLNIETVGNEKNMVSVSFQTAGGSSMGDNNQGLYQFSGGGYWRNQNTYSSWELRLIILISGQQIPIKYLPEQLGETSPYK